MKSVHCTEKSANCLWSERQRIVGEQDAVKVSQVRLQTVNSIPKLVGAAITIVACISFFKYAADYQNMVVAAASMLVGASVVMYLFLSIGATYKYLHPIAVPRRPGDYHSGMVVWRIEEHFLFKRFIVREFIKDVPPKNPF